MVVLGENNLTWLQKKLGFKNLRNVHYYVEAARWARLLDEEDVRPTSLGCRYVDSRFDPRVVLEGVRGRALFEAGVARDRRRHAHTRRRRRRLTSLEFPLQQGDARPAGEGLLQVVRQHH